MNYENRVVSFWNGLDEDEKETLCENGLSDEYICPHCGFLTVTDVEDGLKWGQSKICCNNCKKQYEIEKFSKTFYSTRKIKNE